MIYLHNEIRVPPEHDLSCVSQRYDHWQSICRCGVHTAWTDRESWALMDWRIHVENVLMQPGIVTV